VNTGRALRSSDC